MATLVPAAQFPRFAGLLLAAMVAVLVPGICAQENPRVCASCHRGIWETYRQTGMGRSLSRLSPDNTVEDFTHNNYFHQASGSYFSMLRSGDAYFQRRYQLDSSGQQINVMEKQIDYVLGSGNHSRAYLHRTSSGTLLELPLAWYAEKGGYWAMNPGYDRPDHDGFRRPITYDCIFCHNAYPKIPPGHEQPLAQPVYEGALPEGIDCQRCHGPGSRHAHLAGTPGVKKAEIRKAIVNPSRLPAERQLEICMVCHLETTSFPLPNTIQRYERGPFSYRPGEPLADFILNFDHAPGTGRENKFEIASSAYRLRRSACFLKSSGKLLCTTCHNPHEIPRREEASQHYNGVCRQCHGPAFQGKVALGKHTAAADCVGCHMPKRRTEDVVHVAVTDHYIQRRKPAGDLLAERPERHETDAQAYRGRVGLYYPETLPQTPENELYLAVAQVKQGSNLRAGITQLTAAIQKYSPARAEWYLELAQALDADGQLGKALPLYREAVRRNLNSAGMIQKLGTALRRSSLYAEAAGVLKQAASIEPERALTWHELGLAYRLLGETGAAVAALGKALERDPELPETHNNLGVIWLASEQDSHAESAFREAIRIRPDYPDAHGNLASVLMRAGRPADAGNEFAITLRLRPGDALVHYNYATLLGRAGDYEGAQRELEASLGAAPGFADAHQLLGDLLMGKNRPAEAVPHYREALRIRPESGRAHLGLGAALLSAGDLSEAISHLERAAAPGSDADVRQRATGILGQLRKDE